jgi:hypothetical protein
LKLTNLNDVTVKKIQICSITQNKVTHSVTIRILSGIREYVVTLRKRGEVEVFSYGDIECSFVRC